MDPSRFLRTKPVLAGWIASPLILIGVVYHGAGWYCASMEARLVRDRALLEVMPDLLNGLHRGRDELKAFSRGAVDPDRLNDMSLSWGDIAARQGFTLESARLDPPPRSPSNSRLASIANLEGAGSLVSVLNLLDALQTPRQLVSVENASIRLAATSDSPPRYRTRFVLHYYRLETAGPSPAPTP